MSSNNLDRNSIFHRALIGFYQIDDFRFGFTLEQNHVGRVIEEIFRNIFAKFAISDSSLPGNPELRDLLKGPLIQCWHLKNGRLKLYENDGLPIFHLELHRDVRNVDSIFLQEAEVRIVNYITSQLNAKIWIHGACLKKADKLIFLIAPSGRGKTTLSLGLLHYRYKLLTDDVILINPGSGQVLPYPRCPKVREPASEQLSELGVRIVREVERIEEFAILPSTYFETQPQDLSQNRVSIFFLQSSEMTGSSLTKLNYSTALIEMLKFSNILYQDNQLSACSRLFKSASFYKLRIDTLSKNIQQIEEHSDVNVCSGI